jgi:hypothetical protein
MPGSLLHINQLKKCPHGGEITTVTTNTRVLMNGLAVATLSDVSTVAGCPFTVPGPKPQPCVKVLWTVPSTRIFLNGQPALLASSVAICQTIEQIPQGPPVRVPPQQKVSEIV